MGKRLMTLSDLYNYYSTQGTNQVFSCKDNDDTIVVQVNGNMQFSESENTDGLYPTRVQLNFIGDNLNKSRIKVNAQEKALPTSKFRPLLAYIHEVDGEPQFYGHNMHQDDDGRLIYDEQPVGVIAEEAHIEHDDEYDMDYAVANGYIWEEYSRAAEILQRDGRCDVSVELAIKELSYDAEDKILCLDDFVYSGCTILGVDDDGNVVNPAMPGSNITLNDFSEKNNSIFSQNDKLVEILEKLNNTLSNFNINTSRKEEELVDQIIENAEVTEQIEVMEEASEEVTETTEDEVTEVDNEETEETPNEVEEVSEDEVPAVEESVVEQNCVKYTVSKNGEVKEFSVSLSDKIYAMNQLVNETYSELDGDYYEVDVFEEDKIVEMHSWWTGKSYRQSFKVKKDSYSLVGDRVEIFVKYLTADEITALDNMRANYSIIETELANYKAEPAKMEILNSEDYSQIAETEEFTELKKQENHFEMSVEDLTKKADEILLSYAKSNKLEFSTENKPVVANKPLIGVATKQGRYGTIFSK